MGHQIIATMAANHKLIVDVAEFIKLSRQNNWMDAEGSAEDELPAANPAAAKSWRWVAALRWRAAVQSSRCFNFTGNTAACNASRRMRIAN